MNTSEKAANTYTEIGCHMQTTHFCNGQHFAVNYIHCKWKIIEIFSTLLKFQASNNNRCSTETMTKKTRSNEHEFELECNHLKHSTERHTTRSTHKFIAFHGIALRMQFKWSALNALENKIFDFWTLYNSQCTQKVDILTIQSAINRLNEKTIFTFAIRGILFNAIRCRAIDR